MWRGREVRDGERDRESEREREKFFVLDESCNWPTTCCCDRNWFSEVFVPIPAIGSLKEANGIKTLSCGSQECWIRSCSTAEEQITRDQEVVSSNPIKQWAFFSLLLLSLSLSSEMAVLFFTFTLLLRFTPISNLWMSRCSSSVSRASS